MRLKHLTRVPTQGPSVIWKGTEETSSLPCLFPPVPHLTWTWTLQQILKGCSEKLDTEDSIYTMGDYIQFLHRNSPWKEREGDASQEGRGEEQRGLRWFLGCVSIGRLVKHRFGHLVKTQ